MGGVKYKKICCAPFSNKKCSKIIHQIVKPWMKDYFDNYNNKHGTNYICSACRMLVYKKKEQLEKMKSNRLKTPPRILQTNVIPEKSPLQQVSAQSGPSRILQEVSPLPGPSRILQDIPSTKSLTSALSFEYSPKSNITCISSTSSS